MPEVQSWRFTALEFRTLWESKAHADRFFAVTLPADLATRLGPGWSVPLQDTFGEFQLGIWLRERGVASGDATEIAASSEMGSYRGLEKRLSPTQTEAKPSSSTRSARSSSSGMP